jgi:hypothetical protein
MMVGTPGHKNFALFIVLPQNMYWGFCYILSVNKMAFGSDQKLNAQL